MLSEAFNRLLFKIHVVVIEFKGQNFKQCDMCRRWHKVRFQRIRENILGEIRNSKWIYLGLWEEMSGNYDK